MGFLEKLVLQGAQNVNNFGTVISQKGKFGMKNTVLRYSIFNFQTLFFKHPIPNSTTIV